VNPTGLPRAVDAERHATIVAQSATLGERTLLPEEHHSTIIQWRELKKQAHNFTPGRRMKGLLSP
jgi:hypothetical protein